MLNMNNKTIILSFDTTAEFVSVALMVNGSLKEKIKYNKNYAHAESIGILCRAILFKNGFTYSDVDYLSFTNGPSSFIKIRVGLSHALGIRFAGQGRIKLLNFSLFDIYQFYLHCQNKLSDKYLIILKAFGDNYFVHYQVPLENSSENSQHNSNLCTGFDIQQIALNSADLISLIKKYQFGMQEMDNIFIDHVDIHNLLQNIYGQNLRCQLMQIENLAQYCAQLSFNIIGGETHNWQFLNMKKYDQIEPFYLINPMYKMLDNVS